MFLFPIGFFYACFMVVGKRTVAKQRKENAVFLGMESGWRTNASFDLSIRLLQHAGAIAGFGLIAMDGKVLIYFRAVIV